MQTKMTLQILAGDESDRFARLPYRTPECRALLFRGGDPLCASGDLVTDDEGQGTGTGNSGEDSGYNNLDNP